MKTRKRILPIAVWVAAMIVLLIWAIKVEEQGLDKETIQKMTELEHHNKMLTEVNGILDKKVFLLESQADSLKELIVNDQRIIITLKTRKDEKIHIMDRYTDDELYWYFARFRTKGTTSKK